MVLVFAFGLSACSSDRTFLPALLADPMASYDADGIERIDRSTQAEGRDFIWGKPEHAEVTLVYRIEDQATVSEVLGRAVEEAAASGWSLEQSSESHFRGSKELSPGSGRISIATHTENVLENPGGPQVLSIRLDFGPVSSSNTADSRMI
ncbi:MAG: hypothetical protein ACFCU2_12915 [Acidimicrobiia bacterium]